MLKTQKKILLPPIEAHGGASVWAEVVPGNSIRLSGQHLPQPVPHIECEGYGKLSSLAKEFNEWLDNLSRHVTEEIVRFLEAYRQDDTAPLLMLADWLTERGCPGRYLLVLRDCKVRYKHPSLDLIEFNRTFRIGDVAMGFWRSDRHRPYGPIVSIGSAYVTVQKRRWDTPVLSKVPFHDFADWNHDFYQPAVDARRDAHWWK